MNLKERENLKAYIRREYNIRIVTDLYAEIVNFVGNNPNVTPYIVGRELNNPGAYKAFRRLQEIGIITRDNKVQLSTYQFSTNIYFPLVNTIREKKMPPIEYKYVHIASYLSTCRDDEMVKDTGLTKLQFLEKVQKELLSLDLAPMMYQLQNLLAICSILAGNLDNWTDMNGPIYTGDIK